MEGKPLGKENRYFSSSGRFGIKLLHSTPVLSHTLHQFDMPQDISSAYFKYADGRHKTSFPKKFFSYFFFLLFFLPFGLKQKFFSICLMISFVMWVLEIWNQKRFFASLSFVLFRKEKFCRDFLSFPVSWPLDFNADIECLMLR